MQITINKQIGKANLTFVVDDGDAEKALVQATAFTTIPDKCGLCQGVDVVLESNKAQGKYTYIKVRCQKVGCKATSTMGKYEDKSGFFWKAFEIYNRADDLLV